MRNEDDELHRRRNFHLSCLKTVSQLEFSGDLEDIEDDSITDEWLTLNVTMNSVGNFELVTTSKRHTLTNPVENNGIFPLTGIISPYYMQDKK